MKKQFVRFLSAIAPDLMAKKAFQVLANPQVRKNRPHEQDCLNQATKETLRQTGFDIQTYKWGNPNHEKVMLIHGWEGQAGNFADLVPKLLKQNYYVIAFDGPGHGFSSKGATSFFDFRDTIVAMLEKYECKKLISHSFGGVATTLALSSNGHLAIEKYALITTPDKFSQRIDSVAHMVGVNNKVVDLLIQRIETEYAVQVKDLNVSNFVKKVNVDQAFIIHDKNDKVISIEQSRNVCANWDACQLEEIEGTGHFRILRTEEVLDKVLDFLND